MPENKNQQKAVTLEAMAELAPLLATKEEVTTVKKQVEEIETGGVTFATTEEVLALFQDSEQGAGGENENADSGQGE